MILNVAKTWPFFRNCHFKGFTLQNPCPFPKPAPASEKQLDDGMNSDAVAGRAKGSCSHPFQLLPFLTHVYVRPLYRIWGRSWCPLEPGNERLRPNCAQACMFFI